MAASCVKVKEVRGNKNISHFHLKRFPLDGELLGIGGSAIDALGGPLPSLADDL